jgi:predicted TIM-barrel fold metal-dependent hydrolase
MREIGRWMAVLAAAGLLLVAHGTAQPPTWPLPIIDMHVHAARADSQGPPPLGLCPGDVFPPAEPGRAWADTFMGWMKKPPCSNPIWSPTTDREVMDRSLAVIRRRNVFGVVSGVLVDEWRKAAPERVIPSLDLNFNPPFRTLDDVRKGFTSGGYRVFGEIAIQYQGVDPGDARFEPYLALAEELDVPVAIHVGTGPPGALYLGFENYRARLHSPLLIEEALKRHPRLRVSLMHAGWPMLDDLLAMMWTHPQLYVDVGAIGFALPVAGFYSYLQRIVDAGFGKRVMFGSDQMIWPETIDVVIDRIQSAGFLTEVQKRDILYNNAARFLKLSAEEIARHHGR